MNQESLIIVTGAAGFIGSCMVALLNQHEYKNLLLVDDFSNPEKNENLHGKDFKEKVELEKLFSYLEEKNPGVSFVFHLGARTDTTEFDYSVHEKLNVNYSQKLWQYCCEKSIPFIYASSAATYGAGDLGYNDDENIIPALKPLNPYGISKNEFDKWALSQNDQPPAWAGLKFFNVFGPNEYHKGRMASVVFHSFRQINQNGNVKLFRSYKPEYGDGGQLRDFIYVKDVVSVCFWFLQRWHQKSEDFPSGIYNVGTGKARNFNDLVKSVFAAMDIEPNIIYIDIPEDIRNSYQDFTEAKMDKLRSVGYHQPMYSLEEAVSDYVKNYLTQNKYM